MPVTAKDHMISLGRFLKERREDLKGSPKQISQNDVADALGMAQAYISKLERGSLDSTIQERWQSSQRLTLLEAYRFTDSEVIEIAERFNLELPARQQIVTGELLPKGEQKLIPLYDSSLPYPLQSEPMGTIEIDVGDVGDFGIKIDHDMPPKIEAGDILVIQRDVYVYGNIVMAQDANGKAIFRRLIAEDATQLEQLFGDNPDFTILFEEDDVEIIGRAIEARSRLI